MTSTSKRTSRDRNRRAKRDLSGGQVILAFTSTSKHRTIHDFPELIRKFKAEFDCVALGRLKGEKEVSTLAEMVGLVKQAKFVVTVDTGILALALALGVPTLALFGPTDERIIVDQFHRYGEVKCKVLRSQRTDSCDRPCNLAYDKGFMRNGKCKDKADCMEELDHDYIITHAKAFEASLT